LAALLVVAVALAACVGLLSPAAAGVLDPSDPDLVLWLRADAIAGLNSSDPVGTWADSSDKGNDVSQGTPANQPTYVAHVPTANNQPALRFDSTDNLINSNSINVKEASTAFAVFKVNDASHNDAIFSKLNGDLAFLQWGPNGLGVAESGVAWAATEGHLGVASWQISNYTPPPKATSASQAGRSAATPTTAWTSKSADTRTWSPPATIRAAITRTTSISSSARTGSLRAVTRASTATWPS
jgi:hypothetical protein